MFYRLLYLFEDKVKAITDDFLHSVWPVEANNGIYVFKCWGVKRTWAANRKMPGVNSIKPLSLVSLMKDEMESLQFQLPLGSTYTVTLVTLDLAVDHRQSGSVVEPHLENSI